MTRDNRPVSGPGHASVAGGRGACPRSRGATLIFVRNGWVAGILVLQAVFLSSASGAPARPVVQASASSGVEAVLTSEYEIEVVVTPHKGDAWTRLARRVTGDAANWEEIASRNDLDEVLKTHHRVRIPFSLLKPELQHAAVRSLFPTDETSSLGWKHVVVGTGVEGESLWKIAEWFTGDGANYSAIRSANPAQGLSTRKGDVILIPRRLLTAAFGGTVEEENAPTTATKVRNPSTAPDEREAEDGDVPEAALVAPGVPSLTYERKGTEPYAVYRLQKGEALYSSVGIRFTGRVFAKDVYDVIDRIVKFNDIADVSKLPVGYPVRIPMDLLLPEYLPGDDPERLAREASRRESDKVARRTRAQGLSGVHVIIDAGHGGRDVGTEHQGVWESVYAYDVACRLKEILEKKSGARVSMTTRSSRHGFAVSGKDVLPQVTDHYVQTTPKYLLDDAIVGVNLRWYLANSVFRRAIKEGSAKEKVIFLSIHADSLHPSLRGAMAYIPGASFVTGSYRKRGDIYLARAEVREQPKVTHSRGDALMAEGLSRDLAESIIGAFRKSGLRVHPFEPVRDNVIRNGREWVPAVIRYNQVPTRLLLEVCNLGNRRDRALMKTTKYRQQVAESVFTGIVDFFAGQEEGGRTVVAAR